MELHTVTAWAEDFYARYPIFCYLAGGIMLLLTLWKPAKILKNLFLVMVLLTIIYFAMQLFGSLQTGMILKDQGSKRTEDAIK
jgi:hypothetical protein